MTIAQFILADDQGMAWDKFVPIAIIVVIWIFGALMNQKKQIRRGQSAPPQPPPWPDPQAIALQAAALEKISSKPRAVAAPKAGRAPKPPAGRQVVAVPAPVAVAPPNPPPRVAASPPFRRLQSGALRTRFILTEILRPPVSLRDPDHFADTVHLS